MSDPKGFKVVKNKWLPKTGDIVRCVKHGAEYVVTSTSRQNESATCVCTKSSGTTTAGLSYTIMEKALAPVPPTTESMYYQPGQFVQMASPPYAVGVVIYRTNSHELDIIFANGMRQLAAGGVVPFHGTIKVDKEGAYKND